MAVPSDGALTSPTGLLGHNESGPGTVTPARGRSLLEIEDIPHVATVTVFRAKGEGWGPDLVYLDEYAEGTGKGGGLFQKIAAGTDNGGTIFVTAGGVIYARTGRVHYIDVTDFGAVIDGETNDHDAFVAAAAIIDAAGGGKLVIPPGTAIVGKQTFSGETGLGYSYSGENVISISNCPRSVVIDGTGATLKLADGLRFGAFDPETGEIYESSSPFTSNDYRAYVGQMIRLSGNADVTVCGVELDGNVAGLVIGGVWGDTGRQLSAYGIATYQCESVKLENVYAHHHALDGFLIAWAGLAEDDPAYPHTLINCRSTYNARQGLSWIGGNSLTAIGCDFSHTGRAEIASNPGAGVDVEAESSICRNGLFMNCAMENNIGAGIVADSGDSTDVTIIRSKMVGTTASPIWIKKPRFRFVDCVIAGQYVNPYATSTAGNATVFDRCLFTDEDKYGATLNGIGSANAQLSGTTPQTNVRYIECQFITTRSRPGRFDGAILLRCQFEHSAGTDVIDNKQYLATFDGSAVLIDNKIIDGMGDDAPTDAYYILLSSTTPRYSGRNFIDSASSKIRWWSWSAGAGGYAGYLGVTHEEDTPRSRIAIGKGNGSHLTGYHGAVDILAGTEPSSGDYAVGDIVLNGAPEAGSPVGWVNTVAGSPGTNQPFGIVGGVPSTFIADLDQTISDPPTQSEVQTISDKFDALLTAIRTANLMAPS